MLSRTERDELLSAPVMVEEKVDGANVMCWVEKGILQSSGRSGPAGSDRAGQFGALRGWVAANAPMLLDLIHDGEVLYGEWLFLAHSLHYSNLPDYFVALDLRQADGTLLGGSARRERLESGGLVVPPLVATGRFDLGQLESLIGRSPWGAGSAEGLVLRPVQPREGCPVMAKLVRGDFSQLTDREWARGRPRNVKVVPSPTN